ncbi:MAG: hypothetical protein OXI83_08360 [Gemmatimonadota bacterium]|nr:hypothetical protein [Gemmatimonadota bacterium]
MARHADPGPTGGAVVAAHDGRRPPTVPRPSAGLRALVVVAVVAAAVGVGLWSAHGSASAQAPAASTITTELRPGWNVIGWLGSDTTVADLFRAIPALELVAAWDAEAGRYAWGRRDGKTPSSLEQLPRGQGLYLRLAGTETVQWTRPAADGVVLLRLHAGHNLVTWGGPDGMPVEEALDWLGDAVVGASRWNADTRESERYRPGAPTAANTLRTLNHGDALWVRLSEDASWWQSGTADIEFVLHGDVRLTEEQESEYREELAHVQAFFLGRYGIEPPEFSVHFRLGPGHGASAGDGRINVFWPADDPPDGVPWSHEYFHLLQSALREGQQGALGSPMWLIEGSATYAANLYSQARWGDEDEGFRWQMWSISREIAALRPLEDAGPFRATQGVGYNLGTLATDWLVRWAAGLPTGPVRFTPHEPAGLEAQTEYDSYIQYFRLLGSSATWQEAFETAFRITVDDFYEAFEEYRIGVGVSPPAHLADDRDEPVLVLLGEIPADATVDIRTDFRNLQDFFTDRLGSGPTDYTVYVAADGEAARSASMNVLGEEPPPSTQACAGQRPGIGAFVALHCYGHLQSNLAIQHFYDARDRLAPWPSLPPVPRGYERWGPRWLQFATIAYMTQAGRAALGLDTLDLIREAQAALAQGEPAPLQNLTTEVEAGPIATPAISALSFLAADWLVQRAGERALFEYYRRLPSSNSWQEAFVRAFGIAADEFYGAFEGYRAALPVHRLRHERDDRNEPTLVLLGEIPRSAAGSYRAQLRALQALFRDRFGTEPADYTLYVAADEELAGAEYVRALGRNRPDWVCGQGTDGIVLFMVVGCAIYPDPVPKLHHDAVVRQLAPWESLPLVSEGGGSRGPQWLEIGTEQYTASAYRAATRRETFEGIRSMLRGLADQTEHPLPSQFGLVDNTAQALSFLAADWLAQRAGEPALFEYYRLLPSSDTWQDAFEGAFGITIDDFYQEFAEYRAGL